jgi:hypothetical protein
MEFGGLLVRSEAAAEEALQKQGDGEGESGTSIVKVLLEPGSLVVLKEDSRYTWLHGIRAGAGEVLRATRFCHCHSAFFFLCIRAAFFLIPCSFALACSFLPTWVSLPFHTF